MAKKKKKKKITTILRAGGLPTAIRAALEPKRDDPLSVIRRAYARRYWRPNGFTEWRQLLGGMVSAPLLLLSMAFTFTALNGRVIRERTGKTTVRQFAEQISVYFSTGILPRWYYIFSLYDPEVRKNARTFLNRYETKLDIFPLLNSAGTSPLSNKAKFAGYCREAGLPAVPVLLFVEGGEIIPMDWTAGGLPEVDLFIKPISGRGGTGAERWDFIGNGAYRQPDGTTATEAELIERLRKRSFKNGRLVQPRLVNHPDLRELSNGALSTVRAVTCLNERNEPELIAAIVRMAIGKNVTVDNLHKGGIAAAVDLRSARLSAASNLGADARLGWLSAHPDTGARIEGRPLPMWDEIRSLAERAHRAFSDRTIVGWDIALLENGPVLVEGNNRPDVDIMQRPLKRGIGDQRFGELLAFHLKDRGFVEA